jgi:hypothetical protein
MLAILKTKPHNSHYLNRYIKFIESRKEPLENICVHHILPKAPELFPEYKDLKENPWNGIRLTYREHIIAHLLLWRAFGGSMSGAYFLMTMGSSSRLASKAKKEYEDSGVRQKAVSDSLTGTTTYYYPGSGMFYGRIPQDSPIIKELGLVHIRSEKQIKQQKEIQSLASMALDGSIRYNNGIKEISAKEHPGEGWVVGRLPRDAEYTKNHSNALSKAISGSVTYNDGTKNYRIKPGQAIDPSWVKGMAPQKPRKKIILETK